MTVHVNNKELDCSAGTTLAQLLQKINVVQQNGIALAVNNTVVPKKEWENFAMKENDKVMLIKATQGG